MPDSWPTPFAGFRKAAPDVTRTPTSNAVERMAEAGRRVDPGAPEWLRRFYSGPQADSANQLGRGIPKSLGAIPSNMLAIAAGRNVHRDGRDRVELHPFEDLWDKVYNVQTEDRSPRDTYLHEQGHRHQGGSEVQAERFAQVYDMLARTSHDTAGIGKSLDSAGQFSQLLAESMLRLPLFAQHPLNTGVSRPRPSSMQEIFGSALTPSRRGNGR